jgi:AbiV family abortive infection protein
MTGETQKTVFLKLHQIAHNNAVQLVGEAEILFKAGRYCRAYALAFTALEEISKSQLAADVFTGLIPEQEFQTQYRDHKAKIGRMAWATRDAERYTCQLMVKLLRYSRPRL